MMLDVLGRRLRWLAWLALAAVAGVTAWLLAGCVSQDGLKDIAVSAAVAGVDRAADRLGVGTGPPAGDTWAAVWAGLAAIAYPVVIRPLRLWLANRNRNGVDDVPK